MSSTLTWQSSGLGTKTGTTVTTLITDMVALFGTKSGDANFAWTVASSNTATSPNYIVLKRKDGSAGRILLLIWTSAATLHTTILDTAPTTNALYGAYFPAGNTDTPSNLTATSGTILGDDSGAVKVWSGLTAALIYPANYRPYYFDSAEAVIFGWQDPGVNTGNFAGAGNLVVDASDATYGAVMSIANSTSNSFGSAGTVMAWQSAIPAAGSSGSATGCVRTNYGATNRTYFIAWGPSGWGNIALGSTDILSDTATAKVYFIPCQLVGNTKGEGFVLKLRQMAFGPGAVGAFTVYNTTGPVAAARQFNAFTGTSAGHPWFTNFKL